MAASTLNGTVGLERGIGMTSLRTRQRLVQRLRDQGIKNETVLAVIQATPRHLFIEEALSSRAYEDTALPIGFGQTISQPYIVARMTEALLAAGKPSKVLEVGTGCGYQAVILAQLVDQVYTVERISRLLDKTRDRIRSLDIRNIRSRHADGSMGWDRQGPFNGIILTAAGAQIPAELIEQLAVGGRLIAPVGIGETQELVLVERKALGFRQSNLGPVSFVPMLGGVL